jgi:hypothetical protein
MSPGPAAVVGDTLVAAVAVARILGAADVLGAAQVLVEVPTSAEHRACHSGLVQALAEHLACLHLGRVAGRID